MANPNPKNKFQKGHARVAGAGRPAGSTNVLTKEIRTLLREAAEEVGFIQRVREHIRAARDAGGRNWCPIFYSAEARRTRSEFMGHSRVTGNGLPSSLKRGRTVVNIDVLYVVSIWLLRVLIAVTFHEAAHGYVARFLGDDTASQLGRVSLNPFRHIDPFGTILLPGLLLLARSPFLFGYAKPVPINFRALRSPRIGMVLVAAAGPAMNSGLAIIAVSDRGTPPTGIERVVRHHA